MTPEPRYRRLPLEWGGLPVHISDWHERGAPTGFTPVSSTVPGSSGKIAYFQTEVLEEIGKRPQYDNVVDERTHALLVHLGWTPPAGES